VTAGSFKIRIDTDAGQDVSFTWVLVYPCPFPSEVATPLTLTCGGSGDESATWEWTTTDDNDEDGWILRYGTNEGGPYPNEVQIARNELADPDNPEWTVTGLTNGTEYCAVVTAYWDTDEISGTRIDHNDDIRVDHQGNQRVFTE
jgi:hypothetical protein